MVENAIADRLPPRPSETDTDLRCLGRFWRGQPGDRSYVVEFWLPPYRDLYGRSQAGNWAAALFDGSRLEDAPGTFRHHFPYGESPVVLHGEFDRVDGRLVPVARDQAA